MGKNEADVTNKQSKSSQSVEYPRKVNGESVLTSCKNTNMNPFSQTIRSAKNILYKSAKAPVQELNYKTTAYHHHMETKKGLT